MPMNGVFIKTGGTDAIYEIAPGVGVEEVIIVL